MLTYVFPRGINMEIFIQKTSSGGLGGCMYGESCAVCTALQSVTYRGHAMRYMAPQYTVLPFTVLSCKKYVLCAKNISGWNIVHSKERHNKLPYI
jgi:hypothetical protein